MKVGVFNVQHDDRRRVVTLALDYEAAEFIGMELPNGDGFAQDWWRHVWKPIADLDGADQQGDD